MNAYELADKLEWHWDNDCRSPAVSKSADMLRQQADSIEHYKNKADYLDKRELELLAEIKELKKQLAFMEGEYPEPTIVQKLQEFATLEQALNRIAELEKDLHMVQRHYDQLNIPDGYVVVCVHCAKELKIDFDEPNDLEAKIAKYEEVLHAIANDYHELSDHKIEVQVRNHKRWARDVLSLSGNNAEDVGNTEETLPKGKE